MSEFWSSIVLELLKGLQQPVVHGDRAEVPKYDRKDAQKPSR